MSKKKSKSSARQTLLIDAKGKENLTVTKEIPDITLSEYNKELEELYTSLAKIRLQQYSKNYMLKHIYSRTFKDIMHMKIDQILKSINKIKTSKVNNKF